MAKYLNLRRPVLRLIKQPQPKLNPSTLAKANATKVSMAKKIA